MLLFAELADRWFLLVKCIGWYYFFAINIFHYSFFLFKSFSNLLINYKDFKGPFTTLKYEIGNINSPLWTHFTALKEITLFYQESRSSPFLALISHGTPKLGKALRLFSAHSVKLDNFSQKGGGCWTIHAFWLYHTSSIFTFIIPIRLWVWFFVS